MEPQLRKFLSTNPDLEPDDIKEALEYAAWLVQEEVHSV
jgi:uncharacterized protein (DUF433 family)